MQSELLKDIVAEIRSLEPFPNVATTVLELSSNPDVVPSELIDVIQTDPGITAKVLKLCNSAFYGFRREIASLQEAGNMLGVSSLLNLVLTSSANRYFRNYGGANPASQGMLWKRCIANALSSRLLAEYHGGVDPERAYTAGLLQNLGQLVLHRFVEVQQEELLLAVESGKSLLDAERAVLGLQHAEIGARLATRWDLPEVLIDTIRHHHSPDRATIDPVLTSTVHLAETLSYSVGLGDGIGQVTYDVSRVALDVTGMKPAHFTGLDTRLTEELERARELLES